MRIIAISTFSVVSLLQTQHVKCLRQRRLQQGMDSSSPGNDPSQGVAAPITATTPSALPSVSIQPSITHAPTESPVPSPAPSASPTTSPTNSMSPSDTPSFSLVPSVMPSSRPSSKYSNVPTESPYPSPAPSSVPSLSPSSSPSLSVKPTNLPSVSPTESPKPSPAPSSLPSSQPSSSPSYSIEPSNTPTATPSSHAPSFMPSTDYIVITVTIRVDIPNSKEYVDRDVFEQAIIIFINENAPPNDSWGGYASSPSMSPVAPSEAGSAESSPSLSPVIPSYSGNVFLGSPSLSPIADYDGATSTGGGGGGGGGSGGGGDPSNNTDVSDVFDGSTESPAASPTTRGDTSGTTDNIDNNNDNSTATTSTSRCPGDDETSKDAGTETVVTVEITNVTIEDEKIVTTSPGESGSFVSVDVEIESIVGPRPLPQNFSYPDYVGDGFENNMTGFLATLANEEQKKNGGDVIAGAQDGRTVDEEEKHIVAYLVIAGSILIVLIVLLLLCCRIRRYRKAQQESSGEAIPQVVSALSGDSTDALDKFKMPRIPTPLETDVSTAHEQNTADVHVCHSGYCPTCARRTGQGEAPAATFVQVTHSKSWNRRLTDVLERIPKSSRSRKGGRSQASVSDRSYLPSKLSSGGNM